MGCTRAQRWVLAAIQRGHGPLQGQQQQQWPSRCGSLQLLATQALHPGTSAVQCQSVGRGLELLQGQGQGQWQGWQTLLSPLSAPLHDCQLLSQWHSGRRFVTSQGCSHAGAWQQPLRVFASSAGHSVHSRCRSTQEDQGTGSSCQPLAAAVQDDSWRRHASALQDSRGQPLASASEPSVGFRPLGPVSGRAWGQLWGVSQSHRRVLGTGGQRARSGWASGGVCVSQGTLASAVTSSLGAWCGAGMGSGVRCAGGIAFTASCSSSGCISSSSSSGSRSRRSSSSSSRASGGGGGRAPGLFGVAGLHEPHDFMRMAQETRARCDDLLAWIAASPPNASIVQLMDDLSDELCQTYDAAECCRNVHSDPAWVRAASEACMALGEFISEVNHHEGLYYKLHTAMERYKRHRQAVADAGSQIGGGYNGGDNNGGYTCPSGATYGPLTPEEVAGYDAETVLVGDKLLLDMEKAGISLEPGAQQRMRQLMNQNQHYGMAFNAALADPKQVGSVLIDRDALASSPTPSSRNSKGKGLLSRLTGGGGGNRGRAVHVPLDTHSVNHVLLTEKDEAVRREVFLAGSVTPLSNVQLLDEILSTRREMAEAMGCASYSDYKALHASLAQESGAVVGFLQHVAEAIRPAADEEVQALSRMKGGAIHAWDSEHYMARARADALASLPQRMLSEHFHLGSVLQGFTELMQRVFGISFQVAPALATESWAPNILKLTAEHPDLGPLGTVYLDLCSRPGKYPGAVTFPIRCGRSLGTSLDLNLNTNTNLNSNHQPLAGAPYQLPVMALLADFGVGRPDDICLSYREMRTLMHELGHCCHNLASRTRYQHLWGTRCAQDFVEVPSHLWEHFAVDPACLGVLARHRSSTRDPLPEEVARKLVGARRMFSALELQGQVLMALVDQLYHGSATAATAAATAATAAARNGGASLHATSLIWQHVVQQYGSVPHPEGTHPQARFSHLTIYGGSYYSYVYARMLSAAVWNRHLEGRLPLPHHPASPPGSAGHAAAAAGGVCEGGVEVWRGLLAPGGSVEPVELLHGLLGPQALQRWPSGGWAPRPDDTTIQRALLSF